MRAILAKLFLASTLLCVFEAPSTALPVPLAASLSFQGGASPNPGLPAFVPSRPIGQPVLICLEAQVTADNAYIFGTGDAFGIQQTWLGDCNTTSAEIFSCPDGPEWTGICMAQPVDCNDFVYIVAWGDGDVTNGVLASIRLSTADQSYSKRRLSGHPAWQVYASGLDFDDCTQPTMTQIDQAIFDANFALGDPATTSRTWVGSVLPSFTGTLQVGEFNNADSTDGTCNRAFPQVSCMPAKARWMWYREPGETCAFTGGEQREFLVFRIPVAAFTWGCW